jgi:hypothetical protein
MEWEGLGLEPRVVRAAMKKGWRLPTRVQNAVVPAFLGKVTILISSQYN